VARHETDVQSKGTGQRTESRRCRVRLAALDAADLSLVDAGALSELLLREVLCPALGSELPGEREVEAEVFQLRVSDEVCVGSG
jgi:hypothetical protein